MNFKTFDSSDPEYSSALDFICESSECERRFSEQPSNIIDLDIVSLNSFKFGNKFLNDTTLEKLFNPKVIAPP